MILNIVKEILNILSLSDIYLILIVKALPDKFLLFFFFLSIKVFWAVPIFVN